jgi:DNA-binding MarR family transcriptional regulator
MSERPSKRARQTELRDQFSSGFLDLVYPVHYKISIRIEDAMRRKKLTRHQVAVLWLILSEGEAGRMLRRKTIEQRLTGWFGIGNSAVSKVVRSMTVAPTHFLRLKESPESGREKLVFLTDEGLAELDQMGEAGKAFIGKMVDLLTEEESRAGVDFLTRVSEIVDQVD